MGTFFESGKDKPSAVPKIEWASNPHCLYGYKAMGNIYQQYFRARMDVCSGTPFIVEKISASSKSAGQRLTQ